MEAAVAKAMQKNAVSIHRMEKGKKTERMERPAEIREKKMKKTKGKSAA
jgi:hypothetical protein